jgi:hypothetical protein
MWIGGGGQHPLLLLFEGEEYWPVKGLFVLFLAVFGLRIGHFDASWAFMRATPATYCLSPPTIQIGDGTRNGGRRRRNTTHCNFHH